MQKKKKNYHLINKFSTLYIWNVNKPEVGKCNLPDSRNITKALLNSPLSLTTGDKTVNSGLFQITIKINSSIIRNLTICGHYINYAALVDGNWFTLPIF